MAIINLSPLVKTTGGNYKVEAEHISAVIPRNVQPNPGHFIEIYLLGGQILGIEGFLTAEDRDEVLDSMVRLWEVGRIIKPPE